MSSKKPVFAIVGATGELGMRMLPVFLSAFKEENKIGELRALVLGSSEKSSGLSSQGVKVCEISYDNRSSLVSCLKGVDVLISSMGCEGDWKKNEDILFDAALEAGVKVYFPSEFGTDYRKIQYPVSIFKQKMEHLKYCQSKTKEGTKIKIVCMFTGVAMEYAFCKWMQCDNKCEEWKVVDKGNGRLSMTAMKDIGKYTLAAALLAYDQPEKCPDFIRVYGENRSIQEYATILDHIAGSKTKLINLSPEEAMKEYQKNTDSDEFRYGPMNIMISQGVYDYSQDSSNELLNPGKKTFKTLTVEECFKETGGRPWKYDIPS